MKIMKQITIFILTILFVARPRPIRFQHWFSVGVLSQPANRQQVKVYYVYKPLSKTRKLIRL